MCDIQSYIKSKTELDVNLEIINMKKTKEYVAFKVYVPKSKPDLFLNGDFWPEGVLYRRFVNFRRAATMTGSHQEHGRERLSNGP